LNKLEEYSSESDATALSLPIKLPCDTTEILSIVENYPVIWNEAHPYYFDKVKKRNAVSEVLKRLNDKGLNNESALMKRLGRWRSDIVAFVRRHSYKSDDILYEKLSRGVYPLYMIRYLNARNDLGISEEVNVLFECFSLMFHQSSFSLL
jgi:hypothetical protein